MAPNTTGNPASEPTGAMNHFYNLADLSVEAVETLLDQASEFKSGRWGTDLIGQQIALLFLAPSLRTRCSFEVGIRQLGGGVSSLEPSMFYGLETRDGVRMDGDMAEHIREAVPVLSGFYSGLGWRVMATGKHAANDLEDDVRGVSQPGSCPDFQYGVCPLSSMPGTFGHAHHERASGFAPGTPLDDNLGAASTPAANRCTQFRPPSCGTVGDGCHSQPSRGF